MPLPFRTLEPWLMIRISYAPYIIPHPDTERRLRKRVNGYFAILRTPEYHAAYSLWSRGLIRDMPMLPDPFDLSVSKRAWEASIQRRRNTLQYIARAHATDAITPHDC